MHKDDVARVAEGLSEAQRECLDWVRPCSMVAPYRAGAAEVHSKGLVQQKGRFFYITPLGLAVRAHLQAKDQSDAS